MRGKEKCAHATALENLEDMRPQRVRQSQSGPGGSTFIRALRQSQKVERAPAMAGGGREDDDSSSGFGISFFRIKSALETAYTTQQPYITEL